MEIVQDRLKFFTLNWKIYCKYLSFRSLNVLRASDVIMVFDGVGAFVMVVDGDIIVVVLCDVSMAVVVVGSGKVDVVVSKIGAENEQNR